MEEAANVDPKLSLWRKWVGWAAGSLLFAIVFVIWQPTDLIVALAIHLIVIAPLLALGYAAGLRLGLYTIALPEKDRIILLWPVLAGGFAMWFVTLLLQSFALSTWSYAPAGLALAAGLFLVVRFLLPEDLKSPRLSVFFFGVLGIYCLGTVMVIDLYWVPIDAEVFDTEVVAESADSRGYHLVVRPWGPVEENDRIEVSEETYKSHIPGKVAHIRYKRGLLGRGWRSVSG